MSILLMTAAFKAQIKATPKLVLLALCDCANDQGECYPSIQTLTEKCSAGERTVQDAVAWLERDGFIRRDFRSGRSTVYWITDPRNWRPSTPADSAPRKRRTPQTAHPTPATAAPPPPQTAHPTPANAAPITITQPSIEPSLKPERSPRKRADPPPECPVGVVDQTWRDWLSLRRAKRAPVTETVLRHAQGEAIKAGMTLEEFLRVWCCRGTQGLEAAWLKPHERAGPINRKEAEAAKWMNPRRQMQEPDYIDAEHNNASPIAIR